MAMPRPYSKIGEALRRFSGEGAGWMIIVALTYAPWAYGTTNARTIRGLNWILVAAAALWCLNLFLRLRHRRQSDRPLLPGILVIVASTILLLGWWMAANAHWLYDSDFYLFVSRNQFSNPAPGSVDPIISGAWMIRASLLLCAMMIAADLARNPSWLLRFWWTVVLVGGSIAFFGLVEKATGAEMIFWKARFDPQLITFFATYFYHGNAGAYLNLVLPLGIGLLVRTVRQRGSIYSRTISLLLCLFLVTAVVANTSRMAQFVAAGLLLALAFYFRKAIVAAGAGTNSKLIVFTAGVFVLVLAAIAAVTHLEQPLERWFNLTAHVTHDARWVAFGAALRALPDVGLFGFGPGTFRIVFPYYTAGLPENAHGAWRFLHEDYLQTIIEWGYFGSTLWAIVFFGGMWTALRNVSAQQARAAWRPRQRLFLSVIIFALVGIAVHALVDFPLQIASLQLYVAVYLGVCWSSSSWSTGQRVHPQTSKSRPVEL